MSVYVSVTCSLPQDIDFCQYRCVPISLTELSPAETAACCAPLSAGPLSMEQAGQVAPLLKALADPVRLRLMSLVASREGGEACVCDLNDAFDLSQPTISHHLKVLHEAGPGRPGQARRVGVLPGPAAGPGGPRRPDRLPAGAAARPGLPLCSFIVYRRLTMNEARPLDRQAAETYAAWFKALADGTRVQVVSLLARSGKPLTVREIVAAVPVGPVDRVGAPAAARRSRVRARRGARHVSPVPDQRQLRGLLSHCRGLGDGQTLTRPARCRRRHSRRMTMTPARQPADREQIRAAVAARYGALARAARAGETVTDCEPARSRRAASARPGIRTPTACPTARCGPAWAAATRSRWRTCIPGRRCWTWARGGGIDVLLSARRVGPAGKAYGLDMTEEMLDLARANARQAGAENVEFLRGQIEAIPLPGRLGGRDHLELRDQPVDRPARGVRRELPRPAARRPPGRLRHPRR